VPETALCEQVEADHDGDRDERPPRHSEDEPVRQACAPAAASFVVPDDAEREGQGGDETDPRWRDYHRRDVRAPASYIRLRRGGRARVRSPLDPASAAFVAALADDTETNPAVRELARKLASDVEILFRVGKDGEQDYAHLGHVGDVVSPAAAGESIAVA
jgi:hypothetical protein